MPTVRMKMPKKKRRAVYRHLPVGKWPASSGDKVVRDALASELMAACMGALKSYGIRESRLAEIARDALIARPDGSEVAKIVLDSAQRLADMVAKWGEDQALLDPSGRPAVLRCVGDRSEFASLAREFFPGYDTADVLRFGCEAKAMERVGATKVARLNDCVVFTGDSLLIFAYSVRTVCRYLGTANFNRQSRLAVSDGRPDRTSIGEISEKDLAEFMRVMRPQISDIVEMSNRWLASRAVQTKSLGSRKISAGIQAFLFRDEV